jgi:hypothetical protein
MRGRERARTWNLWALRELSAAKGTARLTWVFITGGSSYGKADVEGVDGVDDDIGLACQGGVAGSTGSLCTHRLTPFQEGLEWEAQVTRGGHASFKSSQPRKEPRWERGEGKRSEGGLSVVGHRLLPRDVSSARYRQLLCRTLGSRTKMTGSKGTSTVPSEGKAQRSYCTGINPSLHCLALRKHGGGRTIGLPYLPR